MLVEKPISIQPIDEVLRLSGRLQELQQQHGLVISVGYQMRYLSAVEVGHFQSPNGWLQAALPNLL